VIVSTVAALAASTEDVRIPVGLPFLLWHILVPPRADAGAIGTLHLAAERTHELWHVHSLVLHLLVANINAAEADVETVRSDQRRRTVSMPDVILRMRALEKPMRNRTGPTFGVEPLRVIPRHGHSSDRLQGDLRVAALDQAENPVSGKEPPKY
jgi:hypothetical protein